MKGKRRIRKGYKTYLDNSDISFVLDGYNDLFSDFDPRGFSKRSLSFDFLQEAERAARDKKNGRTGLNFLMPNDLRKKKDEDAIRKRLKEHFRKHLHSLEEDRSKILKRGFLFIFAGIIAMSIATFLLYRHQDVSVLATFLIILLEPGSWFLFWEGLNQTVFESDKSKPRLEFYRKMDSAKIDFLSY